ncbi:DUF6883 domain-containing protein [Desulfonatronovibrio magnus]|uniref:DUF6883 domain-containing protein n=1 Tax=Desulfonatronovibrio magnus TaxID=698827 RepID=UPI0005EB8FAD|nr:DUF6883 domain-containing protein [Desulfonatronovibrio magnus]
MKNELLYVEKLKVLDYLLNKEKSRGKAAFFMKMGFKASHWEILAQAHETQATSGTGALRVSDKPDRGQSRSQGQSPSGL